MESLVEDSSGWRLSLRYSGSWSSRHTGWWLMLSTSTLWSAAAGRPGRLKVAREARTGYTRTKLHLWIDADHDRCDTRKEVLLAEATKKAR
ncbi:hypothetical protein [Streptomyces sp. NPDC059649]|uniref:hypothetical protein n=1 Tax=Streptomyces sp. NPDC059649 TaxID=3346895 RepID=UPI00368B0DC6